jgi:type VI secretion system protein ImpL
MMDFVSHVTGSVFSLILWVGGIGVLLFLVISYFSGNNLKSQFEKMGLQKPETADKDQKKDDKENKESFFEKLKLILKAGYSSVCNHIRKLLASMGVMVKGPISDSFRNATKELKERFGKDNYKYELPWFVIVGDKDAGKTTVLESIPLSNPIMSPGFEEPSGDPAIGWWFYEKAIVLDVRASTLSDDNLDNRDRDWKALVRCLGSYRPNRPLDGVVIALPASYFMGEDKLSTEELRAKASQLSEKLMYAERTLGLKLPVYILLTKSDKIAGFQGFANEVAAENLNEMIGWSSSYATDISYAPKHIAEAVGYISSSLFQTAITLFAKGKVKEYADDIMLFPQSFETLRDGMQTYMDTLFNFTDYQDHFILRGLYLTGDQNINEGQSFDAPQDDSIVKIPSKPQLVFLGDLFSKKIFKELGVAKPIKNLLAVTNKKVTYVKASVFAAAALAVGLLYLGYEDVANRASLVKPAIESAIESIDGKLPQNASEETEQLFYKNCVQNVLNLLVVNAQQELRSVFIPLSWVGILERRLENNITKMLEKFLAAPIYNTFGVKANTIFKTPLPLISIVESPSDPTSTPEFLMLQGYVQELAQLEEAVDAYNSVANNNFNHPDDIKNIQKVVKYLFNIQLPDSFAKSSAWLRSRVLANVDYRPFNLKNYSLLAEKRLYDLYNTFLRRVLDPKYNYALADQLQQTLGKVENRGVPDIEKFRQTLKDIQELNTFITHASSGQWLGQEQFNPGSKYQAMMETIKQLKMLNGNVPTKLSAVSELVYDKAKKYLQSYGSPLTGHFFTEDQSTKKLVPSPGLITLEKGLDNFLQKPFMYKTDGSTFEKVVPHGKIMHWDAQLIKDAQSIIDEYKKFLQEELPSYPADLQDTLKTIGRKQTVVNLNAILGRAQAFYERPNQYWTQEGEDAARAQTDNLNETAPLFIKLLEGLNGISDVTTYTSLRDLLFEQMYRNLGELDKVLESADYFNPSSGDMSWWQGDKNLMYKAFNASDKQEMAAYLANQFKRLDYLIGEQAAPLVAFLKSEAFQVSIKQVKLIERWSRMLDQMAAYKKDNAASTPKLLEKYITDEGNDITFDNCFEKISAGDATASTGDYFLGKRNQLRKQIYTQCNVIMGEKAAAQYKQIADLFNSYMANVFPFSGDTPNTSQIDDEVSDGAIMEFFKEFDKLTPNMRDAIKNIGRYSESWPKVATFLNAMAEVRNFLDDYFAPKKKDGEAGVTFDVAFRQNKGHEKQADKVLTWAVVAGDQNTDSQGSTKTLRWRLGDNFSFGFQWAQNTPLFPVKDTGDPALATPIANTSLFVYQGFWAMLRAIMLHQPPVHEGGSTMDDTLLKFTVPLGSDPNGASSTNAVLFLKVIPRNARGLKAGAFKIPRFPTEAPQLYKNRES